jgi:HPt (histidine-containing phosphotransfer) domain-containing protein
MERMAGSDPLDQSTLETLERNVGAEVMAVLVTEFLAGVDGRLSRLAQAAQAGNLQATLAESHDLGTESGSLGLGQLYAAARRIEAAARCGDAAAVQGEVAGLAGWSAPGIAALRARFPGAV